MIMDLKDTKHLWKMAIRITEIWYVQIPPKPGHLEMILMNSKEDKIQVSVRNEEFNEWKERLVENKTYSCTILMILICKYPPTVSNSWRGSKILIGEEIINLDIYKQRYKLDIKVIHKNGSGKFVFWDRQCSDIIGIYAANLRNQMIAEGEDDPKAYTLSLDFLLARAMALRVKVQLSYNQLFVIRLSEDPNVIKTILDTIGIVESIYIIVDHYPDYIQVITPTKRLSLDFDIDLLQSSVQNFTQLSSSKVAKHIKTE
ncbi:hypothetical protein Lal_00029846 [Lupinus albus]|nr:hypothetical protein Lal_00029846 [Lupinus albus]